MAQQQPRNWARASKLWFPISSLPKGGTPVVLANGDQSVQWFADRPNKTPIKHERHATDEHGALKFKTRINATTQQHPETEKVTLKPEWWSPAVYVDEHGAPVHE